MGRLKRLKDRVLHGIEEQTITREFEKGWSVWPEEKDIREYVESLGDVDIININSNPKSWEVKFNIRINRRALPSGRRWVPNLYFSFYESLLKKLFGSSGSKVYGLSGSRVYFQSPNDSYWCRYSSDHPFDSVPLAFDIDEIGYCYSKKGAKGLLYFHDKEGYEPARELLGEQLVNPNV